MAAVAEPMAHRRRCWGDSNCRRRVIADRETRDSDTRDSDTRNSDTRDRDTRDGDLARGGPNCAIVTGACGERPRTKRRLDGDADAPHRGHDQRPRRSPQHPPARCR